MPIYQASLARDSRVCPTDPTSHLPLSSQSWTVERLMKMPRDAGSARSVRVWAGWRKPEPTKKVHVAPPRGFPPAPQDDPWAIHGAGAGLFTTVSRDDGPWRKPGRTTNKHTLWDTPGFCSMLRLPWGTTRSHDGHHPCLQDGHLGIITSGVGGTLPRLREGSNPTSCLDGSDTR
jgi:hypothetical protein